MADKMLVTSGKVSDIPIYKLSSRPYGGQIKREMVAMNHDKGWYNHTVAHLFYYTDEVLIPF